MRCETIDIAVPGRAEDPATLSTYILDSISVAPDKSRPAVIVIPGGGYWQRSDREQEPIVLKYLNMGCHAFVLNYSVAPHRFPVSLQELALAVATIREHADEWKVDPECILVNGFSAGGHLACSLGVFWNQEIAYKAIGKTPEAIRPSGLILSYPVITSGEYRHAGSMEKLLGEAPSKEMLELVSLEDQVTTDMPPVFLWHTLTDETVPVENSFLLASALRKHKIRFEMHIYPSGGHGLSLSTKETAGDQEKLVEPCCQTWISLVELWIETNFMN